MRMLIAVCLFMIATCGELFPCTCMGPSQAKTMREVAEWYTKQTDVGLIFEGKVMKQELHRGSVGGPATAMSMTSTGQFRTVSFAVKRFYRGKEQDQVSVLTGLGNGDCGYDFQTGARYLVYASNGPSGYWFTSICSGTSAIEDAGNALRLLDGEKPTAEDLMSPQEYAKQYTEKLLPKRTGSVCGQVLKEDGTPLKGAGVELWEVRDDNLPSRSVEDPNLSTDDGHFCVEYAEPGRYLLTAESDDFDNNARYMAFYPSVSSRSRPLRWKSTPAFAYTT